MSKKKSTVPYYTLCLAIGVVIGIIVNKFVSETPPSKLYQELEYQFCFPPQQKCLPLLLSKLLEAKTSVKIQGYVFTSRALADALIALHQKGVQVTLILDKSQAKDKRSQVWRLSQAGISIFIDYKPAIAHNKIIILNDTALFTGYIGNSKNMVQTLF